jgi:hypothetical protein
MFDIAAMALTTAGLYQSRYCGLPVQRMIPGITP